MSAARQLGLLLWKNWLLQKKKVALTFFEIGLPAIFTLILLLIRLRVESTFFSEYTTWGAFEISDNLPSSLEPPSVYCNNTPPLDRKWRLAFVPTHPMAKALAEKVADRLDMETAGLGFPTEAELETYYRVADPCWKLDILAALVFTSAFPDNTSLPSRLEYKLRPKAEQMFGRSGGVRFVTASEWRTSFTFPMTPEVGPRTEEEDGGQPGYHREGFLTLQRATDLAITQQLNSSADVDGVVIRLQRHPFPPYVADGYITLLLYQFPFIVMLSFVVVAPNICKDIVLEKEKKLKETMKMMGLSGWLHWIAWFIKFAIIMILAVALMTLFLHIPTYNGSVINYSAPSITFVFLFLYAISVIFFCFAVSVFFSKANGGAAAGGIIFLVTYIPYFYFGTQLEDVTPSQMAGSSVLMNLAMSWGCNILAQYESRGVGLQWSTLNVPFNPDHNFTMLYVFLLLIMDCIIYGLITWYFDAVLPGEFGIPKPPYFPFTRRYWCGVDAKVVDSASDVGGIDYGEKAGFFETPNTTRNAGIQIRNIRKVFKKNKKEKAAVAGTTLDMYKGQITALLGHNGAGKTTTISMLTGFMPPTSGTAYIDGFSVVTDVDRVRESIGLCPQHDVLFDTMTVEEHLVFFAKLKGCPKPKVKAEMDDMIHLLRLSDKRDAEVRSLSGGMKRKLSVGIALIAGSKTVILDEPTSGMDPEARRQTWDLLQSQRQGRTMVLSTHFMDEADFLGDRIAIMADGVLQCAGSSLFLKSKYGIGYHLVMVKDAGCHVAKVTGVVKSFVPEARLESNISAELSYLLPRESSASFEAMFNHLESHRELLGISSFGASVTTLEEVFIRVGELLDSDIGHRLRAESTIGSDSTDSSSSASSSDGEEPESRKPPSLNGNVPPKNGYTNKVYESDVSDTRAQEPIARFKADLVSVNPLPDMRHSGATSWSPTKNVESSIKHSNRKPGNPVVVSFSRLLQPFSIVFGQNDISTEYY